MAIIAGSIVALVKSNGALDAAALNALWSPPMFGVVESLDPNVVNWGNGQQNQVDDGALNEILDATNTDLIGHVVMVAGENSSSWITVAAEYKRGALEVVLGMTETGIWRELAVDSVTLVR